MQFKNIMESKKKLVETVYNCLHTLYPKNISFLDHNDTFQLLVGVILSAQTTDVQVNRVLPPLIDKFQTPAALAAAPLKELEEIIRPVGFFKAKAKNIKATSQLLIDNFDGSVPECMEELLTLPGVGRKTANVILGTCFSRPAIIVDTHFRRVVNRIGFINSQSPDKIEKELKKLIPNNIQYRFSMLINNHGRVYCYAAKPKCLECPVANVCGSNGS